MDISAMSNEEFLKLCREVDDERAKRNDALCKHLKVGDCLEKTYKDGTKGGSIVLDIQTDYVGEEHYDTMFVVLDYWIDNDGVVHNRGVEKIEDIWMNSRFPFYDYTRIDTGIEDGEYEEAVYDMESGLLAKAFNGRF